MSFLLPGYDQYRLAKQMNEQNRHLLKILQEDKKRQIRAGTYKPPKKKPPIKLKPAPMKITDILHGGGKVPKTKQYLLKKGEVVMNKTQQNKLKAAKTAAGAKKVLAAVAKKKPKR